VVDSESGSTGYSPTIDSRTGNVLAYGTLSRYRPDDSALAVEFTVAGIKFRIQDNFATLSCSATTDREALEATVTVFERFLRQLSIAQGGHFGYELLQMQHPNGHVTNRPGLRQLPPFRVTVYNLTTLADAIYEAGRRSGVEDEKLSKALLYYEHASFLFELRTHVGMFSSHFAFVLTSAYLHAWKAIALILGEPGTDSDYQSRYKQFGLPKDYWKTEIRPLYEIRNQYDVAHCSMDADAISQVQGAFGKAVEACRRIIKAYSDYLSSRG
jgi:hypothetical protein